MLQITERDVTETLQFTSDLLDEIGPRLAGTQECFQAAERIHDELVSACDSAKMESFSFHREAFLSFMRVIFIAYLTAIPALIFGGHWLVPAILGLSFGSAFALTEGLLYQTHFDRFFRKHRGYNVSGFIEPAGDVKQQIVVSGHHDSAYVFNFFKKHQKLYAPRIILGLILYHLTLLLFLFWGFLEYLHVSTPGLANLAWILWAIGFLFVLQFYFFTSKEVSPGAGDNLIAVALCLKLAQRFGSAKKSGHNLLQHTRLIFASFDAEESGLRGSSAYCRRNREALKSIPTYNFNLESIYNVNELSFLTKDINQYVRLSKAMVDDCMDIAGQLGYHTDEGPITWGGGATDAAEFARIGVHATSLLGMKNRFIRDGLSYHTMEDTVDKIDPAAVRASLEIVVGFIFKKDSELLARLPGPRPPVSGC
jgi:aminopeptidase YwaD